MINKTQVDKITITDNAVVVLFRDGTIGKENFSDYPCLAKAKQNEREDFTVSYFGIHWPSLDEDLSFEGIYKKNLLNVEG